MLPRGLVLPSKGACPEFCVFLLAAFVGLVDGVVRRDIRKFGAGRKRASSITAPRQR